ncbi:hypothetical protein ACFL5V_06855 [Fibrobacterota bacterium]
METTDNKIVRRFPALGRDSIFCNVVFNHKTGLIWLWLVLAVIVTLADFFAGPYMEFPMLFLIPVSLASWFSGRKWGLALAVFLPLVRLAYCIELDSPGSIRDLAVNAAVRIVILGMFAFFLDRAALEKSALARRVKILEGLLPICSFCKRIRNKESSWEVIEDYITARSDARFTHGVCPDCRKEHYSPQEAEKIMIAAGSERK